MSKSNQENGMTAAAAAPLYVQIPLHSDMSIHMACASLLELKDTLYNCPEKSLIVTANINVHRNSRHGDGFELGQAARRVMCTPNAGGRCLVSEVLSVELMDRLFGIQHLMTEMEIEYATLGPITDYACCIDKTKTTLGVSVTRAMAYQRRFTTQDAWRLVTKKTRGVVYSSASVVGCTFERQILHIWVSSGADAAIVRRVCSKLPSYLKSNTIIFITTINMDASFWK